MDDVGLCLLVALVVGGSYKSSCDTPSRPSALLCWYHLEVVRRLVDVVHHRAVDVYYLSKTTAGLLLLLQLRVFARYLFGWFLLRKLQPPLLLFFGL
jgi:hypothetical protein